MADPSDMTDPKFGSRHRAAVGLTKESDAIVVVVSEETGDIRLAERGELSTPVPPDRLEAELTERLGRLPTPTEGQGVQREGFEGGDPAGEKGAA
jgi:diadenylate cyclase